MNKKYKAQIIATVFAMGMGLATISHAEETTVEKVQATGNKAADKVKKGARKASDEVCEMVNGKMECMAKKVKHKAQNAVDSIETKAKEEKNKADTN